MLDGQRDGEKSERARERESDDLRRSGPARTSRTARTVPYAKTMRTAERGLCLPDRLVGPDNAADPRLASPGALGRPYGMVRDGLHRHTCLPPPLHRHLHLSSHRSSRSS